MAYVSVSSVAHRADNHSPADQVNAREEWAVNYTPVDRPSSQTAFLTIVRKKEGAIWESYCMQLLIHTVEPGL